MKIWVLTGDKMETAINIGFSCSLLRQGMKQICITTVNTDALVQDPKQAAKENILMQITNATQMIKLEKDPHAAFALIIDGKTLTHALEDDMKTPFLNLAICCASVICCRVSPKQKALVTRLVKEGTGKTTLAIGDGANDVGMIQEADIGVGISGCEGMQAVMASDFAIAQFRFLEKLLVVHGHWCYKRIAQMICYFFYKNIAFDLTIFYFEAFAGFSGQSVYVDWYMILFNVVLTSLPVISLGVFEQDVDSDVCLQFPALYQQGPKNLFFDLHRIFGWMANGLYTSVIVSHVTNKFDCKNITRMMAKSLTEANIGLKCSQVMLYAFGDRQVLPKNFIKDVRSSNPLAVVEHVSPEHPDACDMSLMSRMQLWARVNRPPLTVVLINGDSDFSNVTSTLRQMGYVVVAVCSKGCVSMRLQSVADCVMDWSSFVTGRGSESSFIHKLRPLPQPFQPSPSELLDNRPISVYWDYDTCPLPEEHKGEKLYETFHDLFKKMNLVGPITISVYVKSERVAEELKVQFQDQHMLLRHVPDDGKPSQNIEAKYNSSKLILVDMGASLFHSPKNVILIITDANLIHLVQNVMLDRAIGTDTTVIVAQSVSNGRRIKYKHAWDWDWPELLSGDRPPRVRSKK